MTTQEMYDRAIKNGCRLECSCVGISINRWDNLMEGATRADKRLVPKIALLAGVISEEDAKREIREPWYNPYNHYKTKTHVVYVHSCIEHFIKVNNK